MACFLLYLLHIMFLRFIQLIGFESWLFFKSYVTFGPITWHLFFSAEKWSYQYLSDGVVVRINIKVPGLMLNDGISMDINNIIYITVYFSFIPFSYQSKKRIILKMLQALLKFNMLYERNQQKENSAIINFITEQRYSPELLPFFPLSPLVFRKLSANSSAFHATGSILPLPE